MASRRQRILETFLSRLQAITLANGFDTDLGETVVLGEIPQVGPDDPPVISVVPGEEVQTSDFQGANVITTLPVEIHVNAGAEIDRAWIAVEEALSDVKRAIEVASDPTRRLGGLIRDALRRLPARSAPRASGSTSVGVLQTYLATYQETWGDPS